MPLATISSSGPVTPIVTGSGCNFGIFATFPIGVATTAAENHHNNAGLVSAGAAIQHRAGNALVVGDRDALWQPSMQPADDVKGRDPRRRYKDGARLGQIINARFGIVQTSQAAYLTVP